MQRIQIQTRTSQLLITHINQGTNHLVSERGSNLNCPEELNEDNINIRINFEPFLRQLSSIKMASIEHETTIPGFVNKYRNAIVSLSYFSNSLQVL
jgi:hypothetical protein